MSTEMTTLQKVNNALVEICMAKMDLENTKAYLENAEAMLLELGESLHGERQWDGLFLPKE